jgi:tetratricopeptide (TPR) repeat protein
VALAFCLLVSALSVWALPDGVENPENAEAHFKQGVASLQAGQFQAACDELGEAIRQNPQRADAYIYMGIAENQLGRFADAVTAFQNALRFNRDSNAAHYNLALSFLGLHKNDEAERELRISLKLDPNNAAADYNLALLLEQDGKFEEASGYLEVARSSHLDDVAVVIHLVDLYFKIGEDAKARKLIREEVKLDSHGTNSMQLGKFLIETGRFSEAIPALERAQSLLSDKPDIISDLARGYLGANQPRRALEILAPIAAEQASWETYYLRGQAYVALDRREDAAKAFLRALSMQPNEASVHYAFGKLILRSSEVKGRQAGVREITKAIQLSPHESEYYVTLADYYFDAGDIPAAIKDLKSATELTPPSVDIYATLAMAELELEGPDVAKSFIDKTIALDDKAGAGYDLLGRYYMRRGNDESAARSYVKAAQLTPQNDIYSRDAAIAFEKLDRPQEGLPLAEQSVKLRPDQAYNHYILGKLYSEAGRRSDAIRELETCVHLDPDNFLPYNLLAVLYKQAGKEDEARRCWNKLKALKEQSAKEAGQKFAELRSLPQQNSMSGTGPGELR